MQLPRIFYAACSQCTDTADSTELNSIISFDHTLYIIAAFALADHRTKSQSSSLGSNLSILPEVVGPHEPIALPGAADVDPA